MIKIAKTLSKILTPILATVLFFPVAAHALISHTEIDPWAGTDTNDRCISDYFAAPKIPTGKSAYTGDLYGFTNGHDEGQRSLMSVGNELRTSVNEYMEFLLSYDVLPGASSDSGSAHHDLDSMEEKKIGAKFFLGRLKIYSGFSRKEQSGDTVNDGSPPFDADFRSHFDHATLGLTNHYENDGVKPTAFPSDAAPTMATGDVEYDARADYRHGVAANYTHAQTGTNNVFLQAFCSNFGFEISRREAVEWLGGEGKMGLRYTEPIRYQAWQKQNNVSTNAETFFRGEFDQNQIIDVPLSFRARPSKNVAVYVGSDIRHVRQVTTYVRTVGGVPVVPGREHADDTFILWNPEIRVAYWGRKPDEDAVDLGELTALHQQAFLRKQQYLLEGGVRFSVLNKSQEDGQAGQSLLDPFGNFQHPFYLFDATEFSQNSAVSNAPGLTGQTGPQNYYRLYGKMIYGFSDRLNGNLGLGYQSGDSVTNFEPVTNSSITSDFSDFVFLTGGFDMRVGSSAILENVFYFVPDYEESGVSSSYLLGHLKLKVIF